MSTETASAAGPVQPERSEVAPAPALQPWLIHALYAAAIVFAAAVLAVGLSERSPSGSTVVVPGSSTVRIVIDGPPENPSLPGTPFSSGSGAVHPRWCTDVCPGVGDSRPADSSRGVS